MYRYNPVIGEFFRCRYDYPDGTVAYYVAEQVSHHPPISAWCAFVLPLSPSPNAHSNEPKLAPRYFTSPENKLDICGEVRPKSKFLGNSAATIMEGASRVTFLDRQSDGEYVIGMPNMYARGILFGKVRGGHELRGAVEREGVGLTVSPSRWCWSWEIRLLSRTMRWVCRARSSSRRRCVSSLPPLWSGDSLELARR